jgi:uncharacterized damage-inducible protein DinB
LTDFLQRQMRHGVWANEQLLERCRALSDDQLELTVPGTYGTIRKTLAHIVASEEGYLVRLLGSLLHEPPLREPDLATLDQIAPHIAHVTSAVERLFAKGSPDPDRVIADTPLRRAGAPRFEMVAWAPAAQFVYHGIDHRSQIDTILSTHGLETLDLQVWPFAMELGASREVKEDR